MQTNQFETSMLSYLLKDEVKIRDLIENDLFNSFEHQTLLDLIKLYFKKFNVSPSETELIQYVNLTLEKQAEPFPQNEIDEITSIIPSLYKEQKTNLAKDVILQEAKYKLFLKALKEHSGKAKDEEGNTIYAKFEQDLREIQRLSEEEIQTVESSPLLLSQGAKFAIKERGNIIPTPFKGLNGTMAAGGMFSPQFHVLMGGSKSFKTGVIMKFATGLVKLGFEVAFLDGENGYISIENRYIQNILNCELKDIIEGKILNEKHKYFDLPIKEAYTKECEVIKEANGGEMIIISFPPKTSTTKDVQAKLEEYNVKLNFKPKVLIFDDISHYLPIRFQRDDTKNSQQTIMDIFALNKTLNTISLSPVQVNRGAVGKEKYNAADVGRDYGIYTYASSIMELNQTDEEKAADVMRLGVVGSRDGESDGIVASYLKLDKPRMQVEEISSIEAERLLNENKAEFNKTKGKAAPNPKNKVRKKRPTIKNLTDD